MSTCSGNCTHCSEPTCVRQHALASAPVYACAQTAACTSTQRRKLAQVSAKNKPIPRDAISYVFDGTLEGFFTAVFEAYARKEYPRDFVESSNLQIDLLQLQIEIETRDDHALRVRDGLRERLGSEEYERIKMAFLSDDPAKGGTLFRYIAYALREGPWAHCNLAHEDVAAFEDLWRYVYGERHKMLQFVRFAKMENGIYFAKINPRANVVPLIMEHFSARFNTQPFLIYDEVHHIAGVYDLRSWKLVETDELTLPPYAPEEPEYQAMWKTFYDAIANPERFNPRLRMNFMPKRLWKNLCELTPSIKQEETGTILRIDRN
ncbi:MAG: DNA metabolism protein [Actinobacteria bacterium]|nr:DNA metabolism protein [Actinomycetota bacterium]